MTRQLTTHPIRTLAGLLVIAFCFFILSASGQSGTFWETGPGWLGAVAWICFLLTALGFLASLAYLAVRGVRSRRAA